jgi:3-oxoacyl-[acyl-carrier-protein] synthase-3
MRSYLSGPAYELGEIVEPHDHLAELPARAATVGMMPAPELWGWGRIHRSELDVAELAVRSARRTLAAAQLDPATIDALVLCSTRFPGGPETHGDFVARVAGALHLDGAAFYGLTLHRCANLLAAVELAHRLVVAGVHRRVLVVTTDRIGPDQSRVEPYALFSDGAASCLVSGAPAGDLTFEVTATASAHDLTALDWAHPISADLARQVNAELTARSGVDVADLRAVMHTNLVTPLVATKERQAGFTAEQLFLENITRVGHCFAADPLINLVDRAALGHLDVGDHVALVTSVPGERFAVLLACCALPQPRGAATSARSESARLELTR